ncbi:hypothetical protein LXA43DRAFT_172747 [Ganoderma leucocontextum]|nr:hypothetical protein LXA43DRAFT_172747 [Ganoderma leucocontextum]
MFRDIRQTIADPAGDRSEAAFSLVDPFVWLHVVLGNKPVEALMTETSLRFALVAEWPKTARHEHTDGWDPLPGYNCLRESYYGLRYLRMLVACATSVFRLTDAKVLPLVAAGNATIVSVVAGIPSAHDAESERRRVLQAIVDEIERNGPADALWPGPEASSKWIRWCANRAASGGQETSSHLHPEAGLVALACEARLSRRAGGDNSQRDEYGSAFSGIAQTPIGISGKCCPLCLRLTQLVNAHFASLGDSEALTFSQPETHGKVLPWDAPQFGIPKSVLTQLRDELREKLVEKAIAVGKLRSPKVEVTSDEEEYEDILAIHSKIILPFRF